MSSFYLAKSGQIFGPYTEEEIEVMREGGSLQNFSWIWDGSSVTWNTLDPPPPLPIETQAVVPRPKAKPQQPPLRPFRAGAAPAPAAEPRPAPQHQAPVEATAYIPPVQDSEHILRIEAICHDHHHALAGRIQHVNRAGCEFVTGFGSSPAFAQKGQVRLSLLDPVRGTTMEVPARLGRIERQNGSWSYHLFWSQYPEILAA